MICITKIKNEVKIFHLIQSNFHGTLRIIKGLYKRSRNEKELCVSFFTVLYELEMNLYN